MIRSITNTPKDLRDELGWIVLACFGSPSNQLLLFWGMYFLTLFWAVNAIHFYYIQWITRQDDDLHWAKLFVPFEDLVECDNVERTRAATFASFCRRQAMGG